MRFPSLRSNVALSTQRVKPRGFQIRVLDIAGFVLMGSYFMFQEQQETNDTVRVFVPGRT
jgi:hypothetical protein